MSVDKEGSVKMAHIGVTEGISYLLKIHGRLFPDHSSESPNKENTVCIPNIGLKERKKRFNSGLILLGIGVLVGIALISIESPWWTRFVLFLPFFAGFNGIFQAREKT